MAKQINPRKLRVKLGLTQQEMAARLGVDQATISRIEAGKPPSKPVLMLLEMLSA